MRGRSKKETVVEALTGTRNVGSVRRDDGMLAKEPGDELVDDGVVQQVQEVIPLVDERPETLVRAIGASVNLSN